MKTLQAKVIFILLALFLFSLQSFAQAQTEKKNAMYISYGHIIWTDQLSLSYERTIFQKDIFTTKARIVGGNFRLNKGGTVENGNPIQWYTGIFATQLIYCLEFGLGVGVNHIKVTNFEELLPPLEPAPNTLDEFRTEFTVMGNIGLRWEFQHFLVRGGLGYPELLYVGAGAKF